MRIVYADPLKELSALIEEAKKVGNVSHVAVTSAEMRACLNHAHAAKVFPVYMNNRAKLLAPIKQAIEKLRPVLAGEALSDEQKQIMFDRMDELEKREEEIKNEVPNMLIENGVTIRVSLR